jgi:hypothetical protein
MKLHIKGGKSPTLAECISLPFTCCQWLHLIEITDSYDLIYNWFDHPKSKGALYCRLWHYAQSCSFPGSFQEYTGNEFIEQKLNYMHGNPCVENGSLQRIRHPIHIAQPCFT